MSIHLTVRALKWLQGTAREHLEVPTGTPACGAKIRPVHNQYSWTRVEDVRALVHKKAEATFRVHVESRGVPILMPTCPQCSVLLDQALEGTLRGTEKDEEVPHAVEQRKTGYRLR